MTIEQNIPFDQDMFQNNSLYNSALILNPDNTTSLRIGTIKRNSKAGQAIIDRAIFCSHSVNERIAHFMADYNLNTNEFSVLYYKTINPVKIPLSRSEQAQATAAFKSRFFENEKAFQEYKEQALKTSDLAIQNVQAKTAVITNETLSDMVIDYVPTKSYQKPLELVAVTLNLKNNTQVDIEWQHHESSGNQIVVSDLFINDKSEKIPYEEINEIVLGFSEEPEFKAVAVSLAGHKGLNADALLNCEKAEYADISLIGNDTHIKDY